MTSRLLDGTSAANEIREGLRSRILDFTTKAERPPKLGILLAGNDPGSEIYVRNKIKNSQELGMETDLRRLEDSASLADAMKIVSEFNQDSSTDGILVQSPLPADMGADAEQRVFDAIASEKDVDGFNPVSVGRLVQKRAALAPCTPSGIIKLLDREKIDVSGQHAVVIGRSDIVGKPMAMLLLHRNATVTICHSRTKNLSEVAATADILVAAIGRPGFVRKTFVKPGSVVIDVGMNRLDNRNDVADMFGSESKKIASFDKRGSVVMGDVHPEVIGVAGALTPVPGGVGPLTIAMLMSNTIQAAENRFSD